MDNPLAFNISSIQRVVLFSARNASEVLRCSAVAAAWHETVIGYGRPLFEKLKALMPWSCQKLLIVACGRGLTHFACQLMEAGFEPGWVGPQSRPTQGIFKDSIGGHISSAVEAAAYFNNTKILKIILVEQTERFAKHLEIFWILSRRDRSADSSSASASKKNCDVDDDDCDKVEKWARYLHWFLSECESGTLLSQQELEGSSSSSPTSTPIGAQQQQQRPSSSGPFPALAHWIRDTSSALSLAAEENHTESCKLLLESRFARMGAGVVSPLDCGALVSAVKHGRVAVARLCLEHYSSVRSKSQQQQKQHQEHCCDDDEADDVKKVFLDLKKKQTDDADADDHDRESQANAHRRRTANTAARVADVIVNEQTGRSRWTALHYACGSRKCCPCVELLLQHGARVDIRGSTKYFSAIAASAVAAVANAPPSSNDDDDWGPLPIHQAVLKGCTTCVTRLLRAETEQGRGFMSRGVKAAVCSTFTNSRGQGTASICGADPLSLAAYLKKWSVCSLLVDMCGFFDDDVEEEVCSLSSSFTVRLLQTGKLPDGERWDLMKAAVDAPPPNSNTNDDSTSSNGGDGERVDAFKKRSPQFAFIAKLLEKGYDLHRPRYAGRDDPLNRPAVSVYHHAQELRDEYRVKIMKKVQNEGASANNSNSSKQKAAVSAANISAKLRHYEAVVKLFDAHLAAIKKGSSSVADDDDGDDDGDDSANRTDDFSCFDAKAKREGAGFSFVEKEQEALPGGEEQFRTSQKGFDFS